jgi:hypothetical protein
VDWITLLIEAVGIVILLVWAVIPVKEFKLILRHIRQRDRLEVPEAPGGSKRASDSEGPRP